ncbi:PDDEXK nuclease domain-containing protein [Desulfonatronospira sp.]|uniref:PDDEXK nuclease domain-containing protein n=1 Tax=Desulfonatronospira sp. TaxID=1962951 RepID=UPI0025C13836|nr:PDDEXK nuclease domain-containing protein [Desulfonatronospira sp.]
MQKGHPSSGELMPVNKRLGKGFSPQLSWSHYRALMRVTDKKARLFYELEAIECRWSKVQLERQIHSSYYERIISNRGEAGLTAPDRERLPGNPSSPETMLKSPYVLEFLGLPDSPSLRETTLEQAIITHLQKFLELGKGFALVGRQKRLRFDDTDLYIDLVFYNCIIKCYLLIDLKMGELSYKDVGQMDGYVRMFDDLYTADDDNPTIGLVLCTKKNEAVARYSVLSERKQIFASKYMLYLPSEEELKLELEKERKMIEDHLGDNK